MIETAEHSVLFFCKIFQQVTVVCCLNCFPLVRMIFWGGIIVCMYVHAPCYGGSFETYYQASGGVVVVNGHWNPQFSIKPTQTDRQTHRQTDTRINAQKSGVDCQYQ